MLSLQALTDSLKSTSTATSAGLAVISLLVAVIGAITQIRAVLANSNARLLSTDERTKLVSFWVAWLDAQAKLEDDKALGAARAVVATNLTLIASTGLRRAPMESRGVDVFGLLLLSDPGPGHRIAYLMRTPFYVAVLLLVLTIIGLGRELVTHFSVANLVTYLLATGTLVGIAVLVRLPYRRRRADSTALIGAGADVQSGEAN